MTEYLHDLEHRTEDQGPPLERLVSGELCLGCSKTVAITVATTCSRCFKAFACCLPSANTLRSRAYSQGNERGAAHVEQQKQADPMRSCSIQKHTFHNGRCLFREKELETQ